MFLLYCDQSVPQACCGRGSSKTRARACHARDLMDGRSSELSIGEANCSGIHVSKSTILQPPPPPTIQCSSNKISFQRVKNIAKCTGKMFYGNKNLYSPTEATGLPRPITPPTSEYLSTRNSLSKTSKLASKKFLYQQNILIKKENFQIFSSYFFELR